MPGSIWLLPIQESICWIRLITQNPAQDFYDKTTCPNRFNIRNTSANSCRRGNSENVRDMSYFGVSLISSLRKTNSSPFVAKPKAGLSRLGVANM